MRIDANPRRLPPCNILNDKGHFRTNIYQHSKSTVDREMDELGDPTHNIAKQGRVRKAMKKITRIQLHQFESFLESVYKYGTYPTPGKTSIISCAVGGISSS